MIEMKLIFVRHGETEQNKEARVQGQQDTKLNRKGIAQARLLARRLKDEKIDTIFCSDLLRARQTAKEIMKHHNVPIKYDKLLRERSFGVLGGKTFEEYRVHREKAKKERYNFRPMGGENFYDLKRRVRKFLKKIYPKYKNKTVLVVAHGGVNRAFLNIFMKKPIKNVLDVDQRNTCVNIIEIPQKGKALIHVINCTKHL